MVWVVRKENHWRHFIVQPRGKLGHNLCRDSCLIGPFTSPNNSYKQNVNAVRQQLATETSLFVNLSGAKGNIVYEECDFNTRHIVYSNAPPPTLSTILILFTSQVANNINLLAKFIGFWISIACFKLEFCSIFNIIVQYCTLRWNVCNWFW